MRNDIHSEAVEDLFEAILSLESKEECYAFFKDICTVNELLSVAQRFHVGEMLLEERTYKEISAVTGASTTTISRVNRLLNDDDQGIEMAYERIKGEIRNDQ
ncbi:MAG: TrpR YerC/YecD [Solobacterium sp.]|nr:TrpR YerC/YecD [Solobacterium sp.]